MAEVDYDIIICGAGLTGSTLALALVETLTRRHSHLPRLRIALIEKRSLPPPPSSAAANKIGGAAGAGSGGGGSGGNSPPVTDSGGRAIALAYGSYLMYESLNLGRRLQAELTPIKQVHVSERHRFGATRIKALEWGLPALGYVLPAVRLQAHLTEALHDNNKSSDCLQVLSPATVVGIDYDVAEKLSRVTVKSIYEGGGGTKQYTTRLVVGADGSDSRVRSLFAMPTCERDSEQTAIIATVELESAHEYIAYERFTPQGLLALLPTGETQCTLIWTLANTRVEAVLALSHADFLQAAQACFGQRLGNWQSVGSRLSVPLRQISAKEPIRPGVILLGNAAQTLHPVAAQGFNLGLRDIATFVDSLLQTVFQEEPINELAMLRTYLRSRRRDQARIQRFTHGLLGVFGPDRGLLSAVRGLGLGVLDTLPPLQRLCFRPLLGVL